MHVYRLAESQTRRANTINARKFTKSGGNASTRSVIVIVISNDSSAFYNHKIITYLSAYKYIKININIEVNMINK